MRRLALAVVTGIFLAALVACGDTPATPTIPTVTSTATPGEPPAISWERSGGLEGICLHMNIHTNGNYTAVHAQGRRQPLTFG
jgi:hypothetical protein